jgi:acyl carrier protein phosphodiesterase
LFNSEKVKLIVVCPLLSCPIILSPIIHTDISSFINEFYKNAVNEISNYPSAPREFVALVIQSHSLTSYSTFEGLEAAFQRIDNRLSKRLLAKECATEYLPILERELDAIQKDFDIFFPQLISNFKTQIDGSFGHHWLK